METLSPPFDLLVLGQGFAGSALALQAHWAGYRVGVVDDGQPQSASRLSSGLLNPIILRRRRMVDNALVRWETADAYYRKCEHLLGRPLFYREPVAELITTPEIDHAWTHLAERDAFQSLMEERTTSHSYQGLKSCRLGTVKASGRLDSPAYLHAVRSFFEEQGQFSGERCQHISPTKDNTWVTDTGWSAPVVLLAQGYPAQLTESLFGSLEFLPARGEGLVVRLPYLQLDRPIHGSFFLIPLTNKPEQFLVGATFAWDAIDSPQPTSLGRATLIKWLESVLTPAALEGLEILDQWSGVRPTRQDREPVARWHPEKKGLGILNGMGSRGGLLAPSLALGLLQEGVRQGYLPSPLEPKGMTK